MDVSRFPNRSSIAAPLVLLAGLVIAAVAYAPGLSGTLHFDDRANLDGLATVVDAESALEFVAQGSAGPTGRPLALATFVPQAYAWPEAPGVLLYTNVCVHLLNGMLVAWLLYLLGTARSRADAATVAAASGALWLLMPILASSSLLVVQRMTLLSATFSLLGFIGYLYGRALLERRPVVAFGAMSASLVLGTGLATLAKENGALLPVFVLIAEATLLPRPARQDIARLRSVWNVVLLGVPTAALAVYVAQTAPYADSTVIVRGFTVTERLLTEARVLWEYLYHAFLPATSNLGPFHDDYPLATDWLRPSSLLAVAAWLGAAGGAVALRRRAPLFSFAVGWYLVGHMLESTVMPLELYFEHRNYVPLVGPIFALSAAVLGAPAKWRVGARAGLVVYGALLAGVLFGTTSLWGKPALAAEMWAIYHPDSQRATQYLMTQLQEDGYHRASLRTLRRYADAHPENASAPLQLVSLSCLLEPDEPLERAPAKLKAHVRDARYESSLFESLRELAGMARQGTCDALRAGLVYELAQAAASNPAYQADARVHHNLHVLMAEHAFNERNLDLTMHHIETALSVHYTMSTLKLAVRMLSGAGLHSAALEFVEEAPMHEPRNPLKAAVWRHELRALETFVTNRLKVER